MVRCEAFAYWACSTIKLAVARLTNNRRTIRAVRVLRECQDNEIAIQNCEYSTRCTGPVDFGCQYLHLLDTFLTDS